MQQTIILKSPLCVQFVKKSCSMMKRRQPAVLKTETEWNY